MLHQPVPDFELPATGNLRFRLSDCVGRKLVIFFYPRDMTSGCAREASEFAILYPKFLARQTEVVGISRDSLKSHEKFRAHYQLPYLLLADTEKLACQLFDVMREKTMYGKKVTGIERSTFLLDEKGVLVQAWRKVKAEGHAQAVLEAVTGY